MAVAHYLEALKWQKEIVKIHTVFGGKNPHPNYLVGGVPCAINMNGDNAINIGAAEPGAQSHPAGEGVVEGLYIPGPARRCIVLPRMDQDTAAVWAIIWSTVTCRKTASTTRPHFRIPRGIVLNKNLAEVLPLDLTDAGQVREEVTHSWYTYPEGKDALHPWDGITEPKYTGPKPPYKELDENGKYSWLKAPRWKGNAMEVGPLARMIVGYASGNAEFKDVVNDALGRLKLPATALFSTLGRTAARGLETRLAVNGCRTNTIA